MSQLFREQVVKTRLGDIGVPVGVTGGWTTLFTAVLVVALIAGGLTVTFGSYSRKARVSGFLAPDKGIIKVLAPHAGSIKTLTVVEGQHVSKGETLCVVDVSPITESGRSADLIVQNLKERRELLTGELQRLPTIQTADRDKLTESIGSLRDQIAAARQELAARVDYLRLTKNALDRNQTLTDKGFYSFAQKEKAEEDAVSAQMQIAMLKRTIAQNAGDLGQAEAQLRGLTDKQSNDRAELQRTLAEINQQILQNEELRLAVILASESGTATRVTAALGAAADPATPLLTIVPDTAVLQANLYAPSSAAGFVHEGARVLLRYDAYPYEKFGLQDATVTSVSRTSVDPKELPFPVKSEEPLYLITSVLAKNTITAFGNEEPLQAGTKFQADLVLESRKIWEWIFEPLIAASHQIEH